MKRRYLLLACVPFALTGCFLKDFTTVARPQAEEVAAATEATQTVATVAAEFDNATDLVVSGYGLVTGLDGTGGGCPPGEARTTIIERLKRSKIENPVEVVDSPDNAIVVVTAVIKPGIRRDELVDVEVTLPSGSKVKSLRGGFLAQTPLVTFTTQGEVRDYLKKNDYTPQGEGNRTLKGHEVVIARGPIQASLIDDGERDGGLGDDPLKRAFVWKGGKALESRAMYIILKADQQRFRSAELVATRLNETFQAGDTPGTKVASARHKDQVAVVVPPRYRLNRPHFMRVSLAVPMSPPADMARYVGEWEEKLQRPETALVAAIQLEALGQPGHPALRAALKSEYPLVRFAAAEALAYQGQTMGAEALKQSAEEHPSLQAYALTALAALDDALAVSKLEELLCQPEPELRYGAFRALREIDPSAELIKGEVNGRSYMTHRVAVPGPSLIHLLRAGRSEIVLFGQSPKLAPPFSLTAGPNITVTARTGDTVATVSRFSGRSAGSPTHVQCSLDVAEILKKMAELGATYADAAEMLTKAEDGKALSCPLAFDALPRAVPVKRLAEAARQDPKLVNESELLAEVDALNTPSLFTRPDGKRND